MTEHPPGTLSAHNLLAVLPRRIENYTRTSAGPEQYLGDLRICVGLYGRSEVPLGELQHDPANSWGLTEAESSFALQESARLTVEQDIPASIQGLLNTAYPRDVGRRRHARDNVIQLIHSAVRGVLLLPRRQIYQEFQQKRVERLQGAIGDLTTRHLLEGDAPAQITQSQFSDAWQRITEITPRRHVADVSGMPQEQQTIVVNAIAEEAVVLSRILLRHAPDYLANKNIWPSGPEGLAHKMLHCSAHDLQFIIMDNPRIDPRLFIDAYLAKPRYFGDAVVRILGHRVDPLLGRRAEAHRVQEHENELAALLADERISDKLHTAPPGTVIELAADADEIMSKTTLAQLLRRNIRALGLQLYLDAVAHREERRTRMPDFSESWNNPTQQPHHKLLADFYGNVRNPRIVILPTTEGFFASNYKRYAQNLNDLVAGMFVRLALVVDLKSSSPYKQITRVSEFSVYSNRFSDYEIITTSSRARQAGQAGVLALWRESAERSTALEQRMLRGAFKAGLPGASRKNRGA